MFSIEPYQKVNKASENFNERLFFSYIMNLDLKTVNRSVYNFFNLLGDVGGLYGLFFSLLATLNGFLNFQNPENFLS